MKREFTSKKRYLLAFLMGTLIFLIGFGITHGIAYMEYQRVVGLQDPTSYQIFQDKLQYSLFGGNICAKETYQKISNDLNFQGQIIGDIEDTLGKDDLNVLFRKKFYTLIQLEHFEYVKLINNECNKNINTLLFFYSNEEKDLKESEELGELISPIYQRNKNNLVVYSFDLNLDSEIMKKLTDKYNITSSVIILNEKERFREINNINEIENYIS